MGRAEGPRGTEDRTIPVLSGLKKDRAQDTTRLEKVSPEGHRGRET